MKPELHTPDFDAEKHEYDGGALPSVTQVLADAGLIDTTWYREGGAQRGKAVHLACQYLDEGDLDEATVDPAIIGYLEAYKRFKKECSIKPEWIEIPLGNGLYAGTPDRVMKTRPRVIWDLKTSTLQPFHKWQLAAYVHLLEDPFSYSRCGLYLSDSGRYTIKEFPKSEYLADLNVFLAALVIYNAKRMNGIK